MIKRHGTEKKAAEIEELAKDFEKSIFDSIEKIPEKRSLGGIPASPYRRMDVGAIGSMVADYPLQLVPTGEKRIAETLSFLLENCFYSGGLFQDMIHSGVNVYLTLAIAQSLLRIGDRRYRDLIRTVEELASPTGQWPEAIHVNYTLDASAWIFRSLGSLQSSIATAIVYLSPRVSSPPLCKTAPR